MPWPTSFSDYTLVKAANVVADCPQLPRRGSTPLNLPLWITIDTVFASLAGEEVVIFTPTLTGFGLGLGENMSQLSESGKGRLNSEECPSSSSSFLFLSVSFLDC